MFKKDHLMYRGIVGLTVLSMILTQGVPVGLGAEVLENEPVNPRILETTTTKTTTEKTVQQNTTNDFLMQGALKPADEEKQVVVAAKAAENPKLIKADEVKRVFEANDAKNVDSDGWFREEEGVWRTRANKDLKYDMEFEQEGVYEFELTARNWRNNIPESYTHFAVDVLIDGVAKKTMYIEASKTEWHTGKVEVRIDTPGSHEVSFEWKNDYWNGVLGHDANIYIKDAAVLYVPEVVEPNIIPADGTVKDIDLEKGTIRGGEFWHVEEDGIWNTRGNKLLVYDITFEEAGKHKIQMEAMNYNGGNLPLGYGEFKLQVKVDGEEVGILEIEASKENLKMGELEIEVATAGVKEVTFEWINDVWMPPVGDSNIFIGSFKMNKLPNDPDPEPEPEPQPKEFAVNLVEQAINVDGNLDEAAWQEVGAINFNHATKSDNEVAVKLAWDTNHLYIAYDVKDASLGTNENSLWLQDGIDLYLDLGNEKTATLDGNDYQLIANILGETNKTGVTTQTTTNATGYVMEIAISWDELGAAPFTGKEIGILLGNNDEDGGVGAQFDHMGLINTGSYARPNLWDTITLEGGNILPPAPPVNKAPVMNAIGNQTVRENAELSVVVSATDEDGDALTYSATGLPEGATFDASTRTLTWTPTFEQAGDYEVTFNVTDGTDTVSETVTITVENLNRLPVIGSTTSNAIDRDANTSGIQVYGGDEVTYSGSANDPDGRSLSWEWVYKMDGGSEVIYSSGTGDVSNVLFAYPEVTSVKSYEWFLRVSDGADQVESAPIFVQVVPEPQVQPEVSFPVDLFHTSAEGPRPDAKKERTVELNVQKLSGATEVKLTLDVFDGDRSNEGELYINGNKIALFGNQDLSGNGSKNAFVTLTTPAGWWVQGKNTLVFKHLSTNGFRVDGATVEFVVTPGPDPEPEPEPEPEPQPQPGPIVPMDEPRLIRDGVNLSHDPNVSGTEQWFYDPDRYNIVLDTTESRDPGTGSWKLSTPRGEAKHSEIVQRLVEVPESGFYTYSYFVKTDVVPALFGSQIKMWGKSSADNKNSGGISWGGTSEPGVWQEVVQSFYVDKEVHPYISIQIFKTDNPLGSGTVYVDDFYLAKGKPKFAAVDLSERKTFDGDRVQIDALGNWKVQGEDFFPFMIHPDGSRPDKEVYQQQGWNTALWSNSNLAAEQYEALGMYSMLQLSNYTNTGFRNYNDLDALNKVMQEIIDNDNLKNYIGYYWDNETSHGEWEVPNRVIDELRKIDSGAPVYALQGNFMVARTHANAGLVDISGTYYGGNPDEPWQTGDTGFQVLQNVQGHRTPNSVAQINGARNHPGEFRMEVYSAIIDGARAIGYYGDNLTGLPKIDEAVFAADMPAIPNELNEAMRQGIIQTPHWTTWKVNNSNSNVKIGSRQSGGKGYLILTNLTTSSQQVTLNLEDLPYTPSALKSIFDDSEIATFNGNTVTFTVPPVGIGSGTMILNITADKDVPVEPRPEPEPVGDQPHIQLQGPNLFTDASVSDPLKWSKGSRDRIDNDVSRTKDGSGSIKLSIPRTEPNRHEVLSKPIQISKSGTYTFSFYAKADTVPSYLGSQVKLYDANGSFIKNLGGFSWGSNSKVGEWEEFTYTLNIDKDVSPQIVLNIYKRDNPTGTGSVHVDDIFIGEGFGFREPPDAKEGFDGGRVQLDELGNFTVNGEAFFPWMMHTKASKADRSIYQEQGWNTNIWASTNTRVEQHDAVGMLSMFKLATYIKPGGSLQGDLDHLRQSIQAIKDAGNLDKVIGYYWDNEHGHELWDVIIDVLEVVREMDPDAPIYALQGNFHQARLFTELGLVDLSGTYVGADPDEPNNLGSNRLNILQNIEGNRKPGSVAQINGATGHPGELRLRVYNSLIEGARAIGFYGDALTGLPLVEEAVWRHDMPGLPNETHAAIDVLRTPHWTNWSVENSNSNVRVGTRQLDGKGYLIITNQTTSTQQVTLTFDQLGYTPKELRKLVDSTGRVASFDGSVVATFNGNSVTFTVGPIGIGSGTMILEVTSDGTLPAPAPQPQPEPEPTPQPQPQPDPGPQFFDFPVELANQETKRVKLENVVKLDSATQVKLTLQVFDADHIGEGALYINTEDNSVARKIELFSAAQAVAANDNAMAEITLLMPASWWNSGENMLRFVHLETNGFRVDSAAVEFIVPPAPTPQPQPEPEPEPEPGDFPIEVMNRTTKSVTMKATKPAGATEAILRFAVNDADHVSEGLLYINNENNDELRKIVLFGDQASPANDAQDAIVTFRIPADWLNAEDNVFRFVHVETNGFRVDSATIEFVNTPPAPQPTPDPTGTVRLSSHGGNLASAIAAVNTLPDSAVQLIIDQATVLSGSITIPSKAQVIVEGNGRINYGAHTLLVNGTFESTQQRVLEGTSGNIVFRGAMQDIHARWWKTGTEDARTADGNQIIRALDAAAMSTVKEVLLEGEFTIRRGIGINESKYNGITLKGGPANTTPTTDTTVPPTGAGNSTTVIKVDPSSNGVLAILLDGRSQKIQGFRIQDITIDAQGASGSQGIYTLHSSDPNKGIHDIEVENVTVLRVAKTSFYFSGNISGTNLIAGEGGHGFVAKYGFVQYRRILARNASNGYGLDISGGPNRGEAEAQGALTDAQGNFIRDAQGRIKTMSKAFVDGFHFENNFWGGIKYAVVFDGAGIDAEFHNGMILNNPGSGFRTSGAGGLNDLDLKATFRNVKAIGNVNAGIDLSAIKEAVVENVEVVRNSFGLVLNGRVTGSNIIATDNRLDGIKIVGRDRVELNNIYVARNQGNWAAVVVDRPAGSEKVTIRGGTIEDNDLYAVAVYGGALLELIDLTVGRNQFEFGAWPRITGIHPDLILNNVLDHSGEPVTRVLGKPGDITIL